MQRRRRGAYRFKGLLFDIGMTADKLQHSPARVVKNIPGRDRRLMCGPSAPGKKGDAPKVRQRQSQPANRGAMIANPAVGFAQGPFKRWLCHLRAASQLPPDHLFTQLQLPDFFGLGADVFVGGDMVQQSAFDTALSFFWTISFWNFWPNHTMKFTGRMKISTVEARELVSNSAYLKFDAR